VHDDKRVGGDIGQRSCDAGFTIYSPVNHKICKAIIIPTGGHPHNHLSFPMNKLTYEAKLKYETAIEEAGILGATCE